MNLSSVKEWFSNFFEDSVPATRFRQADWRIRWPALLLPFLLLALMFFLLRANQLSAAQSQTESDLQLLVKPNNTEKAASNNTDDEVDTLIQISMGMVELETEAQQLTQWLEQGRSTKTYAEHAGVLARMLQEEAQANNTLPSVEFWNGFSDILAILENAIVGGQIGTPESRDLIEQMRFQYAQLRSLQVSRAATAAQNTAAQSASNSEAIRERDNAINASVQRLSEQRASTARMHNRALIAAALSALLFAVLLWGLWRRSRQSQYHKLGRDKNEQRAILQLLDEITPLANGDLRVKATVGEATTGAIADAFNYAVEELRRLVYAVTDSADLVKKSVSETRESAHQLARASSVQAREIHRSSNYLNVMSDTMAQLSAHAVESSRIAELSVQQAHAGNEAVQANVDALSGIRGQAENTTRLMQRLVETATQIHERVNDIQAVAKRTDLLALNATISASAQVSNGGSENINMLSDDIAHLANTLGRASRDIASLSDLIQQDATITLKSMADTVAGLDDGQRTALQASNNLHEIDRVSNELNGLINDIASKSLRQAGVVKQLSANMGVINNITRDSAVQLQDSAGALKQLQLITTELRDSVSDFKLPRKTSARPSNISSKVARPKNAKAQVNNA